MWRKNLSKKAINPNYKIKYNIKCLKIDNRHIVTLISKNQFKNI